MTNKNEINNSKNLLIYECMKKMDSERKEKELDVLKIIKRNLDKHYNTNQKNDCIEEIMNKFINLKNNEKKVNCTRMELDKYNGKMIRKRKENEVVITKIDYNDRENKFDVFEKTKNNLDRYLKTEQKDIYIKEIISNYINRERSKEKNILDEIIKILDSKRRDTNDNSISDKSKENNRKVNKEDMIEVREGSLGCYYNSKQKSRCIEEAMSNFIRSKGNEKKINYSKEELDEYSKKIIRKRKENEKREVVITKVDNNNIESTFYIWEKTKDNLDRCLKTEQKDTYMKEIIFNYINEESNKEKNDYWQNILDEYIMKSISKSEKDDDNRESYHKDKLKVIGDKSNKKILCK